MSDGSESPTPPPEKRPLGPVRTTFAAIGVIIMVLTGACVVSVLPGYPNEIVDAGTLFVFGGLPFGVGLLIFLLALMAGRR